MTIPNKHYVFARHVGYLSDHIPIVAKLTPVGCATPPLPDNLGGRHVGYTAGQLPIESAAWACCDAIDDEYEDATCWPFGDGPGITKHIYIYIKNVQNCLTAGSQRVRAVWEGDDKWHGSIVLRGGTINFAFSCNGAVDPDSPTKFKMELTSPDCIVGTTTLTAGYTCADPLIINFGQVTLPVCCDCTVSGSGDPAEINVYVAANCKKVNRGRHVGYTSSKLPIIAKEKDCIWDPEFVPACGIAQCDLVVSIRAETPPDCFCLSTSGTLPFENASPQSWRQPSFGFCSTPLDIRLTCEDRGNGIIRLTLSMQCAVTNTWQNDPPGYLDINALDLDTLDVEFTGAMADPDPMDDACCLHRLIVRVLR